MKNCNEERGLRAKHFYYAQNVELPDNKMCFIRKCPFCGKMSAYISTVEYMRKGYTCKCGANIGRTVAKMPINKPVEVQDEKANQ